MLICSIRLLCNWSFRLGHYIIYICNFVPSILALTLFVLMALFCAAIRIDSFSLLRISFLSHIQVFSCEISIVCRLKYSYSCFSSVFIFWLFFLLKLVFSVFFLIVVISLPLRLFMLSSSRCIGTSTLFSMLVSPFPPSFLNTYRLSTSSLGCKV